MLKGKNNQQIGAPRDPDTGIIKQILNRSYNHLHEVKVNIKVIGKVVLKRQRAVTNILGILDQKQCNVRGNANQTPKQNEDNRGKNQ